MQRKCNQRAMDALFNVKMTDASIRKTGFSLPKIDKDEIFIRWCCWVFMVLYSYKLSLQYKFKGKALISRGVLMGLPIFV